MVKFLIERPIAVTMVFIALLVLGLVSLNMVPVSLMPEVDIPEVTVRLSSSGTSVREMEEQFTAPVRRRLLQVNHLRDIQSTTISGKAYLKLYFDYGTNLQYAYLDVNEKIDALMGNMPREFERPKVIKASATDIPAFFVSVSLKQAFSGNEERFSELSRFAESVIKKRIEQLPQVAMADITGMDYPEIYIELSHAKAASAGIDRNDIEKALRDNNVSLGNIMVRDGQYIYNVRFSSVIVDRFDLENILIRKNNRVFKLKELAKIGVRSRNTEGLFLNGEQKGISLAVIKKNDVRMEDLKSAFGDLLVVLKEDYPRLNFQISRDQTALLNYSIGNLKNTLILGSVLAVVIMLLFMSDYRSPLLIGITVPLSLVVTLLFFYLAGLSINIISLSGLVLGVGMMIDNSIIVIDNIHQHHRDKQINLACVLGTNEIIRPLISSVLTTCAVFLPMLFISGITGALFYDQAIAVSIGLFVSLAVSLTLLPVYYRLLYKKGVKGGRVSRMFQKISVYGSLEKQYDKGFDFVFRYRPFFIGVILLLLLSAIHTFNVIPKQSFPQLKEDESLITINWNENISPRESADRLKGLFKEIKPYVLHCNANVGKQLYLLSHSEELDINESEVYVKTTGYNALDSLKTVLLKHAGEHYPAAGLMFKTPPNLFEQVFKEEKTPLIVKFWDLRNEGVVEPGQFREISNTISGIPGAMAETRQAFQEYLNLTPNYQAMHRYDVDMNNLLFTLKKALNGYDITDLKNGNYLVPVVLADVALPFNDVLDKTMVITKNRTQIPLKHFLMVNRHFDYKKIAGGKEGSFNQIFMNVNEKDSKGIMDKLNNYLNTLPSVQHVFGGAIFRNRELVNELAVVLLVSVLLLYFILASQFESVLLPLIVLIEIPIDIAGVLLILWLTGTSLNLMSLIGIVVMTGIIINDSILKIDTINRLRRDGYALMDAIHKGGQRRLKPILMTSLTTILALVPFLFGTDMGSVLQRPLAISVIGGMIIGTLVSLYIIPLMYWIMAGKNVRYKGLSTKEQ